WRASKAGAFDFISRERDRRDARRQARREQWDTAWRALRARRNREAGGTGHYRPGLRAYLRDVYDGFWMRQLERRRARRAHTMPSRPVASPLVERMYQQWDGFRSEEHTSELQSRENLVCRLRLEKKISSNQRQ